jgi:hypothetical protein
LNWSTGDAIIENIEKLEKKAKIIKRSRLAYAGMSA